MGPVQKRLLESEILDLNSQQLASISDATYLGWTEEMKKEYEDRRKRIIELRIQLGLPKTL